MRKILAFIILFGIFTAGPAKAGDGEAPQTVFSMAEIEQIIQSSTSKERELGINKILSAIDFDTTWALETIINGLQIEEDYLAKSNELTFDYVWVSWWNIKAYVRSLTQLGTQSNELMTDFGSKLPLSQQTWITIARGFQKKEITHAKLRQIITESENILQKAMAIEAISQYKDTTDIDILFHAMMDSGNSIDYVPVGDIVGVNFVAISAWVATRDMGYDLGYNRKTRKSELRKLENKEQDNSKPEPGANHE